MKIGLISINMYSKGLNFACPLHNWAFQAFLEKHGIENTIIDYLPNYYDDFDLRNPGDYYAKKVETWTQKLETAKKSGREADIALAESKIVEHSRLRDSFKKTRKGTRYSLRQIPEFH